MTTQTYLNNTILAYNPSTDEFTGFSNNVILPFWEGDFLIMLLNGSGATGGLRKFNIDADGTETVKRTAADIGIDEINSASGGAATLSYDGSYLAVISDFANVVQIARIRAADLVLQETFGTAGSGFGLVQSDSTHLLAPDKFSGVLNGANSYLFTGGESSGVSAGEICVFNFGSGFGPNVRIGQTDEHGLFGLSFSDHDASSGLMYAIASPWRPGVGGSGSMGFYSVSGSSLTKIGTIAPASIDATWTTILSHVGLLFDSTDGHVIAGFSTSDVVTNKFYLCKINTSTGAFVWKTAVTALPTTAWAMTHSRCHSQRYHYFRSSNSVYHFNTSDGTKTTETLAGVSANGSVDISDDRTNSVIFYGSFSDAGGSNPDFVGAYMDTGGHHSTTNLWHRYWFATAGGGGGPTTGGRQGGLAFSTQRAWGFVLDGHQFYVLDLGAEGTWVFDLTTGEVHRWYTDTFDGRWDAIAGTMWGLRIVAGDIASTTLWEITATVTTDNDATLQVTHVMTGGLPTRARKAHAVNAVRVADSDGQLAASTGSAVIKLRWSDDNGKTWSAYKTVTITQADYGSEIAFRSLGSFAAPGRVFELMDVGGPIRIDGVDGEIDGLDADGQQT